MKLLPFLLGTGVGYVLGARAGRERYEQLARASRRMADNPNVQAAAGVARAKAGEAVHAGVAAVRESVVPSSSAAHQSAGHHPAGHQPAGHQPAAPGRAAGSGTEPWGTGAR